MGNGSFHSRNAQSLQNAADVDAANCEVASWLRSMSPSAGGLSDMYGTPPAPSPDADGAKAPTAGHSNLAVPTMRTLKLEPPRSPKQQNGRLMAAPPFHCDDDDDGEQCL